MNETANIEKTEPELSFKKISEVIADPLIKIYKAGNLALVFIFIGLLMISIVQLNENSRYSFSIFMLGAVLISLSFFLFLYIQLRNPAIQRKNINIGKEKIDELQELSIHLLELISRAQALSFKHTSDIHNILKTILPIAKSVPFISKSLVENGIKLEDISDTIVRITTQSEDLINDIKNSLIKGDVKSIKKYQKEIKKITLVLTEYLKK